MHSLLTDLAITFLIATIVGYLVERLKQPAIVAYLIAGVIIGPHIGPQLVTDTQNIETISEIGLILLLFIVGLEMQPAHLISVLRKVYIAGTGQFLLTLSSGLLFFTLMGYALSANNLEALYFALAVSLSSTAIVIKILADKAELDSHAGRLTLGILLFQDLWAILVLAIQPNLASPGVVPILIALGKSVLLIAASFTFSRFLLGRIFAPIARTPEMVIMLSIAWCIAVAGSAKLMGLSMEMGALIAGVSISTFPYSFHVNAKVMPLRDVFLTMFFISLGMEIPFPDVRYVRPVILLVGFMFAARFLIIIPLSLAGRSGLRNAFVASLNLAQISEFSLVIAGLGVNFRHINQETLGAILFAMSFTSMISSYLIKYNHNIYAVFEKLIIRVGFSPSRNGNTADVSPKQRGKRITILGYHRGAQALLEFIALRRPEIIDDIMIIDFNLETVRELEARSIACYYGDFGHLDTLQHAGVADSEIIVSPIPDLLLRGTSNAKITGICRSLNSDAFIIATADTAAQIPQLKQAGASEVLLPYFETAAHLTEVLLNLTNVEKEFAGEGTRA